MLTNFNFLTAIAGVAMKYAALLLLAFALSANAARTLKAASKGRKFVFARTQFLVRDMTGEEPRS